MSQIEFSINSENELVLVLDDSANADVLIDKTKEKEDNND